MGLLVLAALGGWLMYDAYATPGTHQEQRTIDEWRLQGSFSHRATVTGAADGTVFEPGAVVRNRSVYFLEIMPVLSGELRLRYEATDAPLDLRIERTLVVRSVEEGRGEAGATVYWQTNRSLGTSEETIEPNAETAVPFRIDVKSTIREARNISSRLGSPGRIQTSLAVAVTATRASDGAEPRTVSFVLPIEAGTSVYRVQAEPQVETVTRTETVTVQNAPGPLGSYIGPALFLLGLFGMVGLEVARRNGSVELSEAEHEWLAYRTDRAEFDEWISAIRLPDDARRLPVAEAATLGDLVDFAIDTDNGVLESLDGGSFHVVHDGIRYTFEAPPRPGDAPPARAAAGTDPGDGRADPPLDAGAAADDPPATDGK